MNGTDTGTADCRDCIHFRRAPLQAREDGCFHPDHMSVKQKLACLDEQQTPGNHRVLNRYGDCQQFEAPTRRPSLWQRLLGLDPAG